MSEAGFRIFREVYRAGAELFYAVMLMLFFRPFMIRRKQDGRKLPVVFAAYLAVSLFTGAAVLPRGASGVLLAVLLTISLYLAYQLFFEKGINNDLDRENLSLTRKIREYEEKAGKKPGTIIPIV